MLVLDQFIEIRYQSSHSKIIGIWKRRNRYC